MMYKSIEVERDEFEALLFGFKHFIVAKTGEYSVGDLVAIHEMKDGSPTKRKIREREISFIQDLDEEISIAQLEF